MEQDPEDESAAELLKQIAAEKVRLVKAGEIRNPRDLDDGEDIVAPFDIPSKWQWIRLDTIGAIIGGGTPPAGDVENLYEAWRGHSLANPG